MKNNVLATALAAALVVATTVAQAATLDTVKQRGDDTRSDDRLVCRHRQTQQGVVK